MGFGIVERDKMIYTKKRVIKVPIIDNGGLLHSTLKEHKEVTNAAHRAYRNRLRIISNCSDRERRTRLRLMISRLLARYIRTRCKLVSRGNLNYSGMNTIDHPIKEFLKRGKNRKRPPRFRRMDLRIKFNQIRVHLDAPNPEVEIAFRREDNRKGSDFHTFKILGSKRYFNRFEDMSPTGAYMTLKKGRIWLSIVMSKEVVCLDPKAMIGLDAGMYSNKSVWIGQLINADGTARGPAIRIPAEIDEITASKQLIAYAKEHNAGLAVEDLKTLNRSRSGMRFGIPTAKFTNALVTACEDNATPLYQVNARGTSSTHWKCYKPLERPKDERGWDFAICHTCGEELSADENAAMNIAIRGWTSYEDNSNRHSSTSDYSWGS